MPAQEVRRRLSEDKTAGEAFTMLGADGAEVYVAPGRVAYIQSVVAKPKSRVVSFG